MEYLGWECSPVLANVTSSWNNKHQEIGESFVDQFEDSNCCGRYEEGKMEYHLPGDIFIPIQHLHENITEPSDQHLYNYSNSEKVSELIQHFPQEAVRLAGTALAKSGGGTSWGEEASTAEFYSNSPLGSGLVTHHFGMQPYDINGFQMSAVSTTTAASLESLDCLLSATNSNTDTSVEDDAINSMFFSDHRKNLWNFAPISSRESESNRSITKGREKAVSQCSSQVKPKSSTKRSIDQSQFFQEDHSSNKGGDFGLISENPPKPKKPRMEKPPSSSNINFQQPSNSNICVEEPDSEAIAQMKEMIYRAAAFRPVNLGEEVVEKPKRKNVKISSDPQTVAARQRREKISEKIRVLQRLVPGGSKMDTATMLDEAANYLRFLRSQVKALETLGSQKPDFVNHPFPNSVLPFNHSFPMQTTQFPLPKP